VWRWNETASVRTLEDEIIGGDKYDSTVRPEVAAFDRLDAPPDEVVVQFYMVSFGLDELTQVLSARGYLRQYWRDERLRHDEPENCSSTQEWILRKNASIWRPDVFGENMRDWSDRETFSSGTWIYPNGSVFDSFYLNADFECEIRIEELPFDDQVCSIRVSSYTHYSHQIAIRAPSLEQPIVFQDAKPHNVWRVDRSSAREFRKEYPPFGSYDIVDLNLHLSRKSRFHVLYSMLPAALLLVMNWTGFFVDRNAAPARVTIALIPLLTLRLLLNSVFARVETVSYDIYLASYLNIAMLLSAACVVQYAVVQALIHREREALRRRQNLDRHRQRKQQQPPLADPEDSKVSSADDDISPERAFADISRDPVAESDLVYLRKIFDRHQVDGKIDPAALSLIMRYHFGVYVDQRCARDTMLSFRFVNRLRVPRNPHLVRLNFPHFRDFVTNYDAYDIGRDESEQHFAAKPASLKVDLLARAFFLPAAVLIFGLHYAIWVGTS